MDLFGLIIFILATILIGLMFAATMFIFCTPVYFFFGLLKYFEKLGEDEESR